MIIGIDVRLWGTQHAGIGRYTEELVKNLQKIDKENSYILFCRKKDAGRIPGRRKWKKVIADIPHYTLREQTVLPFIFNKERLDLLHVPHFNVPIAYSRPFVVTIHDVLWHDVRGPEVTTLPGPLYTVKYLGYKLVVRNAVYKSERILVPSATVREDLAERFMFPKDKIAITYEGFSIKKPRGEKKSLEVLKKLKIKKPYLLYVGNLYPHKNIGAAVAALKLMESPPVLVVVCARSIFWERFKNFVEREKARKLVKLIGRVSDKELGVLYGSSEAFILPTLSEGFGLPGLEAMAAGTAVLCSDIGVLREIYGEAALYFDPADPRDIKDKLESFLVNPQLRSDLVKKGRKKVKHYSWHRMAEETFKAYGEAVK